MMHELSPNKSHSTCMVFFNEVDNRRQKKKHKKCRKYKGRVTLKSCVNTDIYFQIFLTK